MARAKRFDPRELMFLVQKRRCEHLHLVSAKTYVLASSLLTYFHPGEPQRNLFRYMMHHVVLFHCSLCIYKFIYTSLHFWSIVYWP